MKTKIMISLGVTLAFAFVFSLKAIAVNVDDPNALKDQTATQYPCWEKIGNKTYMVGQGAKCNPSPGNKCYPNPCEGS